MKVLDLHTGEVVTLPPLVAPGRYRLLEAATLNGTVGLNAGAVLWSDGGTRCDLQGAQGTHRSSVFEPISADQADDWELVDQGVLTVAKLMEQTPQELPAPLMPSSLTNFADPSAFEQTLERVLDAGHLHEISAHPRMNMRYDATVLPVSRARRLASGAVERLASRSEDWHRRTLSGVEPARVLAEVSEDEWGIYENVVFARLIDRALWLISRRERNITKLIKKQKSAIKLSKTQDLHYRLRHKLCELWGKAWDAKPQEADDPLQTRLKELRRLSKILRQLRFGPLYQEIARSARVPLALKNTNVLTHDPHYREMRELWKLAHQGELEGKIKPEEKIRQRMAQHEHYDNFLGLLIRHALKDSPTIKSTDKPNAPNEWVFAGANLKLEHRHACEWQFVLEWPSGNVEGMKKTLTFVAAWAGRSHWQESVKHTGVIHQRQLVYCHPLHAEDELTKTGEDGVLNPLQFYAVERIKQRIDEWLYRHALSKYPVMVKNMPISTRDRICREHPRAFVKMENGLMVVAGAQGFDAVRSISEVNDEANQRLQDGLSLVSDLSRCRVCGNEVEVNTTPENKTFWAQCQCGYEWGAKIDARTQSHYMVFRFKNKDGDFRRCGAWWDFPIPN